ncbi:hypothetical protein OZY43_07735 [Lactobacillus sp. ESL0785]|uniref:hypothetical protein n=1 Tax=Lactobacillus sp. ESL0785 TaxID=2983232 RepID=UPI0023F74D44|nr:hypothetical protein [Lactobacillus sp. ESL0785]WEV70817.1 hypothetical protein OZY43_07735 [Lactobacillus sp. ESL0785]
MKKKLLRNVAWELLFLIGGLSEIFMGVQDHDGLFIAKHLIWAVVCFICAAGCYFNAKDIKKGKRDEWDDDERNRYINNIVDARVHKWMTRLALCFFAIFVLLYNQYKNTVCLGIAAISLIYWNIDWILQVIFGIIEEQKN